MCEEHKKKLCLNYLEGLNGHLNITQVDVQIGIGTYQYEYPPLLEDLIKYVPYFDVELINKNESLPLPPLVQLSYVLPSSMCELLPVKVQNNLKKISGMV